MSKKIRWNGEKVTKKRSIRGAGGEERNLAAFLACFFFSTRSQLRSLRVLLEKNASKQAMFGLVFNFMSLE